MLSRSHNWFLVVDSIHQQLNIPVASIEPRAYAMADGAAAIEMAKKLLG